MHQENSHLTSTGAQAKFCNQLSNDDCPFNMHLYNLYKTKEESSGVVCMGVAPKGLLIFDLRGSSEITLISTFGWSSVAKIIADVSR